MSSELKDIFRSFLFPLLMVVILTAVKLFETELKVDLGFLGVHPLHWNGLWGILTAPLVHGDWAHLYSNAIPLFVLGACLFYFYPETAWRAFFTIYVLTGLWVWFGAREAWHIGASGIIYGLAAFLFLSGVMRKDRRLMAISLFVIFIYGGLVWGIFPEFFPGKNISWESHLYGIIAGIVTAWYYRRSGPPPPQYSWELEEEETAPDWYPGDEVPPPPDPPDDKATDPGQNTRINYIYKKDNTE